MQCTRAADKLLFCQTFGYQRGRLKTRMSTHRVGYYSGGGGGSPVAEHCGLAQDRRSGPGHSLAAEAYDLRACVAYYANQWSAGLGATLFCGWRLAAACSVRRAAPPCETPSVSGIGGCPGPPAIPLRTESMDAFRLSIKQIPASVCHFSR